MQDWQEVKKNLNFTISRTSPSRLPDLQDLQDVSTDHLEDLESAVKIGNAKLSKSWSTKDSPYRGDPESRDCRSKDQHNLIFLPFVIEGTLKKAA
jgi:hypothetical protein